MKLSEEVKKFFKGEVADDDATLERYSKDASLFKVRPKLVVFPKDSGDLQALVKWAGESGKENITVRAAGTDMSGGPLSESIVADVSKYFTKIGAVSASGTRVEPGVFYRNFEKETLKKSLILPCYTASKELCALGGMFGNNCAGEKTLHYGKMENFVLETKVIFSDGKEYTVKPLSRSELETKIGQNDFEGEIYRKLSNLIAENKNLLEEARPKVSKNSAGYYLWNVSQKSGDEETFDLNRLLVGSQGTLGIMTEVKLRLVPVEPASKLFVIFLHDPKGIAELINAVLPTRPESIESYDDATMKLAFKFFPEILKNMHIKHFLSLIVSFIPEFFMMLRGGVPRLIVLVEYAGKTVVEIDKKMDELEKIIHPFKVVSRKTFSEEESNKYWTVRRESFNLLRKHVYGARTAPFVDDVVVRPEDMSEFLPKMRAVLDKYKMTYTVAGHAGNGNFHIIPLMNMKDKNNVEVIKRVGEEVYSLVAEFKGSITGEHNDGIVRTPYLHKMYKPEVLELFKKTKEIFDPKGIFNPRKKTGATLEYLESHVALE
ncbi:MAG: FAD-binding oxidoreductase [Minisyncoccia bacterium]